MNRPREKRRRIAVSTAIVLGAAAVIVVSARAATADRAVNETRTQPVATVAALMTRDYRVAVVAQRSTAGAMPTADVRVAVATRVGNGWRERGEMRLRGTYFWKTVSGPHSICRLQIATASSQAAFRPYVLVQLLRSPALGCGDVHRFTLPNMSPISMGAPVRRLP